ncbi:hypothetical protein D3C79_912750 [compost metagenome]
MVGAGEHNPLDAVLACGLIDMKGAANIGVENVFERTLRGNAPQVNDGVHALGKRQYPVLVRQVATDHLFMVASRWRHRTDIGSAHDGGVGLQGFAQDLPEPAGSAGQQQAVEGFARSGRGECGHGQHLGFKGRWG